MPCPTDTVAWLDTFDAIYIFMLLWFAEMSGETIIQTLRSVRIAKFAVFDFVLAFGGMYKLAHFTNHKPLPFLLATLPFGVLVHHMVGVNTPLTRLVMTDVHMKLLMLMLVYLAVREW